MQFVHLVVLYFIAVSKYNLDHLYKKYILLLVFSIFLMHDWLHGFVRAETPPHSLDEILEKQREQFSLFITDDDGRHEKGMHCCNNTYCVDLFYL